MRGSGSRYLWMIESIVVTRLSRQQSGQASSSFKALVCATAGQGKQSTEYTWVYRTETGTYYSCCLTTGLCGSEC